MLKTIWIRPFEKCNASRWRIFYRVKHEINENWFRCDEKLRYFLPFKIQSWSLLTRRLGTKMPTCEVSLIESLRVSKFSYFHSYWLRLLIDYYCSQWQETQNIANHLIPKWAWVKLMILRKNWGVYKYFDDSWRRWTTRWNWWWLGRGVRGRNRRRWFHSSRFGTETLRNCERGFLVSKVFDITLLINAIWVIMGYY